MDRGAYKTHCARLLVAVLVVPGMACSSSDDASSGTGATATSATGGGGDASQGPTGPGTGGSQGTSTGTGGATGGSSGTGGVPADVFWLEDWEGTGEEVAARWSETSCANPSAWPDNDPLATNSSPARASSPVYDGEKSLQYHFTGLQPDHGGCYSSRHFPGTDEIWMRWYEYWGTGMVAAGGEVAQGGIGGAGTKRHYMYDPNGNHGHVFTYMWGAREISFSVQAVFDAAEGMWGSQVLYQNGTPFSMPDDQWICYEAHLKYNTPGMADGIFEGFATNMTAATPTVQFASYTDRQWRGTSPDDPTPPTANWGTWKVYTQDGLGDVYDDGYAIGPSRIGCQ
jgi:hypothetical protein